jgi:hypothetical protein
MKKLCIAFFTALAISSAVASNINWSSPPTTLSTSNQNASSPQIATDGSGNMVAVWVENGVVKASLQHVGMSWGAATSISGTSASSPCVVSDSSGNITAIWNAGGLIQAASHPSGGSWSSATTLSGSNSTSPTLAVDSAGDVVAVWVSNSGAIIGSIKPFGGNWPSRSQTIGSSVGASPFVSMGGSGSSSTAAVVWQGTSSGVNVVYASSRFVSGSWSTPVVISDTAHSAGYAHIAVDSSGDATAVWYKYDLQGSLYSNVTVSSATKASGGNWGAFNVVSASGVKNPASLIARVGYDQFGNAIALWTNSYDGATLTVESALKPAGAAWGDPVTAVNPNTYAYEADLSVLGFGDALSVYMFYNGQSLLIQSVENDTTGFIPSAWSVPLNIGVGAQNGFPHVAATLSSNTLYAGSVWLTENGSNINVVASTGSKTLVLPPTSPSVAQTTNNFGVFSEFENTVSWTASTDPNAVGYVVYRNGLFIGQVTTTSFVDHNAPQTGTGSPQTYGIASIDAQDGRSAVVSVTIM